MIYPSADKLESWGSRYSLVVLAAKRAKQIKAGAPPLIATDSRNALTIALEEIASGQIQCQVADHDILPKTAREAEVAELLAIPTLSIVDDESTETDTETATIFSDDTELISDEDEEDEVEIEEEEPPVSGLEDDEVEEEEEEPFAGEDDEDEPVAEVEPDILAAPEEPKPKRGRKKKVDPDAIAVDEPEDLGLDSVDSDD